MEYRKKEDEHANNGKDPSISSVSFGPVNLEIVAVVLVL